MKNIFRILAFSLLVGPCCGPMYPCKAQAATNYYVDSRSGSDTNAGTSMCAPWKTIANVKAKLSTLKPGDGVLFRKSSTWNEELDLTNVNGTISAPIAFGNYKLVDTDTRLPLIEGGNVRSYCIAALGTNISYVTIDGIECENATKMGIVFKKTGAMPGIVVQNSSIHNTGPGACTTCGTQNYGNDPGGYYNQLFFGDYSLSANGTKFVNNKVFNCGGHNCIQIHGDTGAPLIQNNVCHGWVHNCIDLKIVKNALVTGNTAYGPSPGGSALYAENTGIPQASVTWTKNVVYNAKNGIECEGGGGTSGQALSCKAYNNTISIGGESAIVTGSDCTQPITWDVRNNILDTSSVTYFPHVCSNRTVIWDYNDDCGTHVTCQNGYPVGAHDKHSVNPLFMDPKYGNFHLQSMSPLRGAGQSGLPGGSSNIGAD